MDKFVLLVSILLVASGQSEEPGFRIALTSKGLDYSKTTSKLMLLKNSSTSGRDTYSRERTRFS